MLDDEFPLSIFYSTLKSKLAAWCAPISSPRDARGFASDNSAGVHPAVLEAIAAANEGHAFGYGHDDWTRAGRGGCSGTSSAADAQAFLVWGGTAANVLSLRAACRPWEAAICADCAHLNVDEAGAPEAIAGVKLLERRRPSTAS